MKGSECRLIEYMEGAKKRFIIPVYQRNYDWKTENCRKLFDDLVKMVRQNRRSHFFGSLVSVYEPSGRNTEFLVIDGQQRLTTVSLLFLAMYNLMEQGKAVSATPSLAQQIYEEFLVDKYQPQETRIKLKPVKNDQKAFGRLFDRESDPVRESNLTMNYNYFYERIQKQEVSIDELFDAVCRLEIINITLNGDDNPQLIFESLNSTGLDLSEGDKIRNFILMGLPAKEQNEYYDRYWNQIEECTKYDVTSFVRDYLSVKRQSIPSQKKIYIDFKEYVEGKGAGAEEVLTDMLAYARRYQILLKGETESKALNGCICRLNHLETTVTRPFFLEVLRLYDEQSLDISQVTEIFLTAENYLFRRTMCDLPTNALNKIFLMLHREVIRYDGTDGNYVEKFKYALLSKKERARFPDDEEFGMAFAERQVYQMNSKNKVYLMERLENYGTAEDKDIYSHCSDSVYSIEHIMPQHLTPAWMRELGEDYERIHDTWLHRAANLTLTAYNSKYGNSSFSEKKTMKHGFTDSGIRMNTYIAAKEKWTLKELEERSSHLTDRALEIWKLPETGYRPEEKQLDSCALDDDVSLSGRLIARFSYKSAEQPVTSWIEMFERVLKILHTEDKSVLVKLSCMEDDGSELAPYVSARPERLREAIQMDEDVYVEKNTSTSLKISLLRRFFKLYHAEPSDLIFYLRSGEENADEEEKKREKIRRRYWTCALEEIKKAHGESGAFQTAGLSKSNWIGSSWGFRTRGFSICCIANYDCARVELYLGNAQKEENKRAFDRLKLHQQEIETALGTSLFWNRGDDIKSSKVFLQLEDVSIEKERDWPRMARFHAEWSRKFYDVMRPYAEEEPLSAYD